MNGDSDSSQGIGRAGIVWPGLIVVALAIVGYYTTRSPLETSRPSTASYEVPPPPSPPGVYAVHARLWEDPLAAAYRDPGREAGEAGWVPLAESFAEIDVERDAHLGSAQRLAEHLLNDYRSGSPKPCRKADRQEVRRIFRAIVEGVIGEDPSGNGRLLCMPVLLPVRACPGR